MKMISITGIAIASLIAASLTGCAGFADTMSKASGMGVVTQSRSTFDNAMVVNATPAPLYAKGSWGNVVRLGARWISTQPDKVALVLSYASNAGAGSAAFLDLQGIDVNVDGTVTNWPATGPSQLSHSSYNTVSNTIYTNSENLVIIPYSLLQQMVNAKDCRLRIHTGDGAEESQFSIERIPGGQPTALLSIRELVARVDAARS
jgi:hypothetical protein